MRFLKKKIAAAQVYQAQSQVKSMALEKSEHLPLQKQETTLPIIPVKQTVEKSKNTHTSTKQKRRPLGSCFVPETSRETKNLVKNYGKAICNFSTSSLAVPYLAAFVKAEGIELNNFLEFAEKSKVKIDGLHHFREILLSCSDDSEKTAACRRIYKQIGEVFIKYFSVNWIFHSKVKYKKAHLDFRYKMLRRIKSPEFFTYLKCPKNTSAEIC